MGSLIDLTGKVLGRLTVLGREINTGKVTRWICLCSCGKRVSVDSHRLRKGITKSCGCLADGSTAIRKSKDVTGWQVGRLKVLRRVGSVNKKTRWECACDCGNTIIINYQHIKDATVKSCGCYAKEISVQNGRKGKEKISGARSHLYKPSLTDEERSSKRNMVDLREWRKIVFSRDDYTCDICGQKGGVIEAHHLKNWADNMSDRFDTDNGITLCKKHHRAFHYKIGTRSKCDRTDYEKFKAIYHSNRETEEQTK